ncbi:tubulin folding cofactor D [Nomia melanderi]|uniref:tubulin folding cofactor D n=1 Tax=Nomia melanderi TaxID=2448451 RepID=UPI00130425BF|nr:tubulin-specific chaperone D [Nomia melanderi]XP_031838124.1 tubulin-specific chaperone D [Nomia melanderi]
MVLNDCPDPEIIGCGFSAFKEIDEVTSLIAELKKADLSSSLIEKNRDRFNFILSQYQDQRQLLDPYLDDILQPLIEIVKNKDSTENMQHNAFKYIFIIMSVKTYKKIVTYLPHEVSDLLPVLRMLEKQDPNDVETWETRYVLLIWLSIISKIPFPLSRLETSEVDFEQLITVRILKICKLFCLSKDACAVAAVFLIANFLTRSDVKKLYLKEMIMWSLECVENDPFRHGPLAVIASILKHSAREDVKPFTQIVLDKVLQFRLNDNPADLIRKFGIKIVQRIGLVLLGTKLASWRYHRTSRSICLQLNAKTINSMENLEETKEVSINHDDQDIPSAIEDIIEHLIQGLRDKAITIRWSAAKGIGRITARLPMDLADDVVGFVLNLFCGRESDSAWHGGCLALAELGRRGLLLPHRLSDVIPVVLQALVFDEPRAYGSIGYLIRDAACYICWSFPRAYDPDIFQPYVKEIAATLLVVTCFDREINCRRAASAAFQENVGRQGNFPHGIEILTTADYFEVGVRNHAYLKISTQIARYEEYTKPLIDHLVARKITHWDTAIRELSAKALFNLTSAAPSYIKDTIIPSLLDMLNSIDLNIRHGAVLAIAEILEALHNCYNEKVENIIEATAMENIGNIVSTFRKRGQFKGLGGELMKQACAVLIKKCSIVHFPISMTIIYDWQNLLEECLGHEVSVVRTKAAEAHTEFFFKYYATIQKEERDAVINRYLDNLQSSNQLVRIGFAQAIGYFPLFIICERVKDVIPALIKCTEISELTLKWAESRKEAIHALIMVCQTLGIKEADKWEIFVHDLYNCYLLALKEYTIDSRGDIGAWVREAAMMGLHMLTNLVFQAKLLSVLNEELMAKVIGGVAQQAVERIDGIRAQAGTVFSALIHSDPPLPNIPYHTELKSIFPYDECKDSIEWRMESVTFPRFIKMLSYPPYTMNLLQGIIFSVGGLSESLVKHSSVSLFSYLQEIDEVGLKNLCYKILTIFEESHKNERMITSILAFLDRLLSSGCIQIVLDDVENGISERILMLLKQEVKNCNNTKLLISSINVFCQLLQVRGPVVKRAFCQLSIFLCHKYKCIRKVAATRTYEALTLYGEEMDLTEQNLMQILTELNVTDWEKSVSELRPIRNHLCELMEVPTPILQNKIAN